MKTILSILTIAIASLTYSQVIIGDNIGTATNKSSVLMEFAAGQNKGIILPYVTTLPSGIGLVEGTIILNATNPTQAKVEFYNGSWNDLSNGNEGNVTTALADQLTSAVEAPEAKVIIGASTSPANGVLVLEASDKAMVLPMVNNTDDVIAPAPGMMVYINKPGAKRLAVFNGNKWTFWKPSF
jgi:hypothetical protein